MNALKLPRKSTLATPRRRPRPAAATASPTPTSVPATEDSLAAILPFPGKPSKILGWTDAPALCAELRRTGRTIVHCHGTFDLLHPGHIVHLEEARALGDVLVVTFTSSPHVNKGPGRPYFDDTLRARTLAALACVDYVVAVPHAAAVEAIDCVRPHIYCKGREYADAHNDVTGNIADDVTAVQRHGGEVRYLGSVVFSSTRLLNRHFSPYPEELRGFCHRVAAQCPPPRFRELVENFAQLRVLVVGDLIFDRYTTLEVQGLTSKNRILSGRYVGDEMQAGGALAVFRHLREFTPHVRLLSFAGQESWVDDTLSQFISPAESLLVRDSKYTTIVKQRFVEPRTEGKELNKLFAVNFLDRQTPSPALQRAMIEQLALHIDDVDLVLVMDFGHGALEEPVRDFVQEHAPFLAVNCQTNSANHGFNILNRRYHRADAFSLDQAEMQLAAGRRSLDYGSALTTLHAQLNSRYGWLTRGSHETFGFDGHEICQCAPFERTVIDTVGAGDAFCAAAALAAAAQLPLDVATFLGQLAGAQLVKTVGNAEPVRKSRLLKAGMTMLTC